VAAVTAALIGALLLAAQVRGLRDGHQELATPREHGVRAPAHAILSTGCSGGRGVSCEAASVRLDFTDETGEPETVAEEPIDGSLHVPRGHRNAEDPGPVRQVSAEQAPVATTVVHAPARPHQAQAAGALRQGVLDLAKRRRLSLTLALVLLGGGIVSCLVVWPQRSSRP
jgi:hypothetical protein